jgi:hypothetical protein
MTRGARLRRADALLPAAALVLIAACLALDLRELLRGGLVWMPLTVEASASGGAPRVRSFWSPEIERRSGLARGDELVALAGERLAGVGRLEFAARLLAAAEGRRELPVTVRSRRAEREIRLPLPGVPFAWRTTLFALGIRAPGAIAFWRARLSARAPLLPVRLRLRAALDLLLGRLARRDPCRDRGLRAGPDAGGSLRAAGRAELPRRDRERRPAAAPGFARE